MGDLGFGAPFNMLVSGEEHWAIKLLNEGMDPLGFMFPTWFFRTLVSMPRLTAGYFKFITFCGRQIENRAKRQEKQDVQDIAHYLIDAFEKSDNKKAALPQLHADSRLIIVAGSDTTAATLTHLFYHIAADPSVAKKLREELEPRLGDGEITHLKIQDATYLNGCINEALRLNPPVPSGVFRKTPKEGSYVGDTFIPGDTTIQMPGYVIGHGEFSHLFTPLLSCLLTSETDNEVYPSADSFIPERWSSRPDLIKHKDAFQPFSSGPFGCIGKNLALMEIRLLTTQLVTLFDVEFAPGETGKALLEKSTDHFTMGLAPMELVFSKRK
jgi:cytochrome P450